MSALLEVRGLHTHFLGRDAFNRPKVARALNGVDLTLARGEILGIVGETGAGKSLTVQTILGTLRRPARRIAGEIVLDGARLHELGEDELNGLRGSTIGLVVQSPVTSLDPPARVGEQIVRMQRAHRDVSRAAAWDRGVEMLRRVGVPSPEERMRAWPHELSGGMAQRVVIAMALVNDPLLLIADEPTTGLDVTVQTQILDLIRDLVAGGERGVILVTHDLGVVAQYCGRVAVMYAGVVVEEGPVAEVFTAPRHPYTAALLEAADVAAAARGTRALPPSTPPNLYDLPPGCLFAPPLPPAPADLRHPAARRDRRGPRRRSKVPLRVSAPLLAVRHAVKHFPAGGGRTVHALNGVDLDIAAGETVGLVGESGSGKTTLGRLILRLDALTSGTIAFDGHDLTRLPERRMRPLRPDLQMVFQSPYASLNPRMTIGALIEEPLRLHRRMAPAERRAEVRALARRVALSETLLSRYVNQVSGGQLQRAAIARAIATRPKLVVLDEPTSSLDLSVRAEILSLLQELKGEHRMAMLFISHDLETVKAVCDRIAVMYLGRIVETGSRADVFDRPAHPYTRTLLSAQLSPDPRVRRERLPILGEPPSPLALPKGCGFAARCPVAEPDCVRAPVAFRALGPLGHLAACLKVQPRSDSLERSGTWPATSTSS